jgi:hypothetical protein
MLRQLPATINVIFSANFCLKPVPEKQNLDGPSIDSRKWIKRENYNFSRGK